MRSILVIFALLCCVATQAQPGPGVIVMLKPGVSLWESGVDLEKRGLSSPARALVPSMNIWLVYQPLERVKANPSVILAQENHTVLPRAVLPNDSLFAYQWALRNDGSNGVLAGADIDAVNAWDLATGGVTANGDTIVVAVIDIGFDLNHEDIDFFKNRGEIPGNLLDDDGNLYIDDYDGWNAYNNNGVLPVEDHGTHVSGIIGARGNNTTGVTGINWNVKIMPIAGASTLESDVIAAYGYVHAMRKKYDETNGAEGAYVVVANSSFGINNGDPVNFPIWCALYDSLGTLGILSVGSGPNSPINVDTDGDMPTTCPSDYLIGVNNSMSNDTLNPTTGFGKTHIDLAAPGTGILNTVQLNGYSAAGWSGASMSAAHVSGAAALMMSAANSDFLSLYASDPGAGIILIKNTIMQTVDLLPTMDTTTASGGRLDLYGAVAAMQTFVGVSMVQEHRASILPNPSNDNIRVSIENEMEGHMTISDMLGRTVVQKTWSGKWNDISVRGLENGIYMLQLQGKGRVYRAKFAKFER